MSKRLKAVPVTGGGVSPGAFKGAIAEITRKSQTKIRSSEPR
jgi:hypothetical protein